MSRRWLRFPILAELRRSHGVLLRPRFKRLGRDAGAVGVLADDLVGQCGALAA